MNRALGANRKREVRSGNRPGLLRVSLTENSSPRIANPVNYMQDPHFVGHLSGQPHNNLN